MLELLEAHVGSCWLFLAPCWFCLAPFWLLFAPFGLLFGSLWLPIGSLLITFASHILTFGFIFAFFFCFLQSFQNSQDFLSQQPIPRGTRKRSEGILDLRVLTSLGLVRVYCRRQLRSTQGRPRISYMSDYGAAFFGIKFHLHF